MRRCVNVLVEIGFDWVCFGGVRRRGWRQGGRQKGEVKREKAAGSPAVGSGKGRLGDKGCAGGAALGSYLVKREAYLGS